MQLLILHVCVWQEIVRIHFHELGTVTRKMDPEVGYLMSSFYNDRDTEDICQGRHIQSFIDWLESRDPMVTLPEHFIFVSRVNIMLRGMGTESNTDTTTTTTTTTTTVYV